MMNYEEFKESITEQIRHVLPEKYRDAEIEISPVEMINKKIEALFVRPVGENKSVGINLEQFYQRYDFGDADFQDMLSAISDMIQNEPQITVNLEELRNYETAKERLFFRVCGVEQNEELLESIPHRTEEDLAVTYHLFIGETNNGGMASSILTNDHLKAFGISEKQLHHDALENSPKLFPATFIPMNNFLQDIFYKEMIQSGMSEDMAQIIWESMMPEEAVPMYVLSNEKSLNGAGALFYPEMMDKMGDTLGKDLIILPSSTHEVIIIPDEGKMTALEAQEMVTEVNRTEVHPDEQLTNGAYHYDREAHMFEKFSSYEARMEEKKKDAALDTEVPQDVKKTQDGIALEETIDPEKIEQQAVAKESVSPKKQEREQATRSVNDKMPQKRESVLKKLEAKKAEAKERDAGKTKDRTRDSHHRDDTELA